MLANWKKLGSPIGQPMLATHGVSCLSSMEFYHACHVRDRGYSCLLAMFPMCVMFESWFRLPPWTCMPVMGVPNSCNINTSPLSGPRRNAKEDRWVPWSARLQGRSQEICKKTWWRNRTPKLYRSKMWGKLSKKSCWREKNPKMWQCSMPL